MLRGFVAASVIAIGLLCPVGSSAATAQVASSACGEGSWVAGTVDVCDGVLVYRDYVYDSFGARPGVPGMTLPEIFEGLEFQSVPNLDAYGGLPPAGGQKDQNQTDLVALRIRVSGGQVHVSAELNTMTVPNAATLVIAIDTDNNAASDGGTLPDAPLEAQGWDVEHAFAVGDPGTNLIEGSFAQPAGTTWKLWSVITKPDHTPMNVAFRGLDETGWWWEDDQADALEAGDISAMSTTVLVSDLTGGATQRATVPPGAKRQRVYISQYPLGEGIDDNGVPGPAYTPGSPGEMVSQAFTMLGKYQPYGFFEPTKPGPHGLQLGLHGLSENHSARLYLPGTGGNFVQRFGEDLNRVIATPLGRGWKGWYSSYSERDVFDVMNDVEANYPIDTNRRILSGYSMGGYGTMRIAALHPDLFAGAVNWVGFTGDVFSGTPFGGSFFASGSGGGSDIIALDYLAALRHVPMAALYAGQDELVHVTGAVELRSRLSAVQVPSIFYLHVLAEHLTFAVADDWSKEAQYSAGRELVHDPAHVVFQTERRLFLPELGLVPDHAYWVSEIVPAGDGYATVDALSLGCNGADEPVITDAPGTGFDPTPWVSNDVSESSVNHLAKADRLELITKNVASLHIDLQRACLSSPDAVHVVTDEPLTVSFSNGETRTFEPEVLARTGWTPSDLAPVLLALALALRLVVRLRRVAHTPA